MKNINSKKNKFLRKRLNPTLKKRKYGGFMNSNNKDNKNTTNEKEEYDINPYNRKESNTYTHTSLDRHSQIEKIKQQVKQERESKLPSLDSLVKEVDYNLGSGKFVKMAEVVNLLPGEILALDVLERIHWCVHVGKTSSTSSGPLPLPGCLHITNYRLILIV